MSQRKRTPRAAFHNSVKKSSGPVGNVHDGLIENTKITLKKSKQKVDFCDRLHMSGIIGEKY